MNSSQNLIFKYQQLGPNYYLLKKLVIYSLYGLLPIVFIHYYFSPVYFYLTQQCPSTNHIIISSPPSLQGFPPPQENVSENVVLQESCDYTKGEWVPNKLDPLYNDSTCNTIKVGRNCIAYGRPGKDYLHWKWEPKQCKLPRFEPKTFLTLLKNKHMAFVGDSLARNQIESLICMIANVSKPNLYYTGEDEKFRKWHIPPYNINISIYWSPFLVKGVEKNNEVGFNTLFLDQLDEKWASDLGHFDILVFSAGHWFLHQAVYKNGSSVLGCHFLPNCTEFPFFDVYRKALKTTFDGIIEREGENGKFPIRPIDVILVTFSPAHFEGEWDKLGSCSKTRPYKGSEKIVEGVDEEMRKNGVGEVKRAKLKAKKIGESVRFEAMDITKLALLRPDGHPGPYMNPFPFANGIKKRVQNDCVHWCLPGAIDTWNEILLDLIQRTLK